MNAVLKKEEVGSASQPVKEKMDLTGKWHLIFEHFAKERLLPAMQDWGVGVSCPIHGGSDGFRLFDDGTGGSICNTCKNAKGTYGFANGFKTLSFVLGGINKEGVQEFYDEKQIYKQVLRFMEGLSTDELKALETNSFQPKPKDFAAAKRKNTALMKKAQPVGRGPVAKYIYLTRGFKGVKFPNDVYYIPKLSYVDTKSKEVLGEFPCMISAFRDLKGNLLAVHRTYLTEDGVKAPVPKPKKMTSGSVPNLTGGAIHLYSVAGVKEMGITEGIESAIGATALSKIPTWAAYSAQVMEGFEVPDHIEVLHIFADKDVSGRGFEAAFNLMNRLMSVRPDLVVYVHEPDLEIPDGEKGVDFADQFIAGIPFTPI